MKVKSTHKSCIIFYLPLRPQSRYCNVFSTSCRGMTSHLSIPLSHTSSDISYRPSIISCCALMTPPTLNGILSYLLFHQGTVVNSNLRYIIRVEEYSFQTSLSFWDPPCISYTPNGPLWWVMHHCGITDSRVRVVVIFCCCYCCCLAAIDPKRA